GIEVGNYPDFMPLVIQIDMNHSTRQGSANNLDWSTYYGGSHGEVISRTASNNNDYTSFIGSSVSTNFPVTTSYLGNNGASEDLIVGQHSPNEVQEWVTYWGGTKREGEGATYRQGISMVPSKRKVWIVSSTRSKPTANNLSLKDNGTYFDNINDCNTTPCSDILIGQFLASGTLNWGTLLGGHNPSGFDRAFDCEKNKYGFYVVGEAAGTNFLNDIGGYYSSKGRSIIVHFKDQQIYWGTKFGNIPEKEGRLRFFETDFSNGDFYIGGRIRSGGSIPTTGPGGGYIKNTKDGNGDAFLASFDNSSKNLKWSTYFGGSKKEIFMESKINNNKIIMTGGTNSSDYPTLKGSSTSYYQNQKNGSGVRDVWYNNFSEETFLTVFDLTSKKLTHSTYFGGKANEMGFDIDVDKNDNIYIVGQTASGIGFPFPSNNSPGLYVNDSHNDGHDEETDGFICGFNNQFNLKWSTYFGGNRGQNSGYTGGDLSWDLDITPKSNLYLCGWTISNRNFPLNDLGGNSYFDGTFNSNGPLYQDGFISRIDLSNSSLNLKDKRQLKNEKYIIYNNKYIGYTIKFPNKSKEPISLKMYNIRGKVVGTNDIINKRSNKTYFIDGEGVSKGVYILRIRMKSGAYSEKLVFK
ncbi:MAG: T9SS type A sorting domain-containing protein, partial [Flavobacteriales bacterium]